ncbi:unnamed protein product [Aureobasidium uvarum]|uniref:Uncharacterized protein n=1 Tax=Aureobasidium uvarum TaxID=2773716 RepID=A0A9N8KVD5_9PEZI|nr:unnamed protein product [Aureobasidium uvarum]
MSSTTDVRAMIMLNCQLSFIDLEEFCITVSIMKRGEFEVHTAYVVAGPHRVTVARASGSTANEALSNLLVITSF